MCIRFLVLSNLPFIETKSGKAWRAHEDCFAFAMFRTLRGKVSNDLFTRKRPRSQRSCTQQRGRTNCPGSHARCTGIRRWGSQHRLRVPAQPTHPEQLDPTSAGCFSPETVDIHGRSSHPACPRAPPMGRRHCLTSMGSTCANHLRSNSWLSTTSSDVVTCSLLSTIPWSSSLS